MLRNLQLNQLTVGCFYYYSYIVKSNYVLIMFFLTEINNLLEELIIFLELILLFSRTKHQQKSIGDISPHVNEVKVHVGFSGFQFKFNFPKYQGPFFGRVW